jgi:chromosome segregation ATPase
MTTDPSLIGGSADLGKGLFGYRRSDVRQLLSDRDLMLREAEKRIRGSEARIAQLETALAEASERNTRMEEQLGRLRAQSDALTARGAQVELLAGRIKAEVQRINEWRRRAQAVTGAVRPSVERFRVLLDELPVRVEDALSPVAGKIPSLAGMMNEFVQTVPTPIRRGR